MNETSLSRNISSNETIAKAEEKNIKIKTESKEKEVVTVCVFISFYEICFLKPDECKLSPIDAKYKNKMRVIRTQSCSDVVNHKAMLFYQDTILKNHMLKVKKSPNDRLLLCLNDWYHHFDASALINNKVIFKTTREEKKIDVLKILPGCTSIAQPVDVEINKTLKCSYRLL
eukprot:gene336-6750_t